MSMRSIGRLIGRLILVAVAVFSVILGALVVYVSTVPTQQDQPQTQDAIVCLGAGLSRSAGYDQPGPVSRARAETCAALYAAGVAPIIVVTGYGAEGHPVSTAMAGVLREAGVPDTAIINEPRAQSTIQNAAYGVPLLPDDVARVIIVTDRFHLPRAALTFRLFTPWDISGYASAMPDRGAIERHRTRTPTRWLIREAAAYGSNAVRLAVYAIAGGLGVDRDTRIGWFN